VSYSLSTSSTCQDFGPSSPHKISAAHHKEQAHDNHPVAKTPVGGPTSCYHRTSSQFSNSTILAPPRRVHHGQPWTRRFWPGTPRFLPFGEQEMLQSTPHQSIHPAENNAHTPIQCREKQPTSQDTLLQHSYQLPRLLPALPSLPVQPYCRHPSRSPSPVTNPNTSSREGVESIVGAPVSVHFVCTSLFTST
jgi:hypothetical protein